MYFNNNDGNFTVGWEFAYQTLYYEYQQLQQKYMNIVANGQSLQQKIDKLTQENQIIKSKINQITSQNIPNTIKTPIADLSAQINEKTSKPAMKSKSMHDKIRPQRSIQTQDGQNYECTYEGCTRVYTSPVSLNLHIKIKHRGGTKKERQIYAVNHVFMQKMILDAEQRGEEPPVLDINLPPNFIQEFKNSYEYMKKYSL